MAKNKDIKDTWEGLPSNSKSKSFKKGAATQSARVVRTKGVSVQAPSKKKKGKAKYVLIPLLCILLVVGGIGLYYVYTIGNELHGNTIDANDSDLAVNSELITDDGAKSITNIALFGVDQRKGEQCRSDSIMIMSVDKKHNKIKLSSIMRDSYVDIEGYGKDKVTHAYYYGGPVLAIKTLNQNFNMNIKEYVTVNFEEMAAIIDAVGGVTIDISEPERQNANKSVREQAKYTKEKPKYIKKAGKQTLDGNQAVAYARIRYVGNADFERTDRQREVLQKVFNKALKMNPLQYPEFARKFLPLVQTSLDMNDVMSLASIMLRDVKFADVRFPQNSDLINGGSLYVNGTSYLYYDLESTAKKLKAFIYDDIKPE